MQIRARNKISFKFSLGQVPFDTPMDYNGIEFRWTGHDGFRISAEGKVVYIDPFQLGDGTGGNDADVVFVSHNHFDHLSIEDIKRVVSKDTTIVAAQEGVDQLKKEKIAGEIKGVLPGDSISIRGIAVEVVRAYNTNKKFHPRADRKVGFVLKLAGMRIYHTGDTDDIPEMSSVNPDIALVPVSGTYVMTAEEAARAINEKIKPKKLAIPMHYGSIVGSRQDAEKFKELVKVCPVQILERE